MPWWDDPDAPPSDDEPQADQEAEPEERPSYVPDLKTVFKNALKEPKKEWKPVDGTVEEVVDEFIASYCEEKAQNAHTPEAKKELQDRAQMARDGRIRVKGMERFGHLQARDTAMSSGYGATRLSKVRVILIRTDDAVLEYSPIKKKGGATVISQVMKR